jgi:enamine deaminase RidA (YjgF/YER057c/UK114 family)
MPRDIVSTSKAAKPSPTYSQAVKAAGLVFVSGTAPTDPATGQIKGTTIQEQTRQCLTNVAAILEAAGNIFGETHAICGDTISNMRQPRAYSACNQIFTLQTNITL